MNDTNAEMTKRTWERLTGDARRELALARWALRPRRGRAAYDARPMSEHRHFLVR
jgi:hypothetical protein